MIGEPLAHRLKPKSLEEFVGQEHIIGEGKLLTRLIEADRLKSIILYGPPGTGKTSLANIIANTTKSKFYEINATTSSKKDMENIINEINKLGTKAILFIDEIHRFNKAQQDFLLPHVERGYVILIGATTESPYHEVNKALVSRSSLLELKLLEPINIKNILIKALENEADGFGKFKIDITEEALNIIADYCGGDARNALNSLELAVLTTKRNKDGTIFIDKNVIEECMQKKALKYDKSGSDHYNTISAFIKSMRGSDPQAALYYLGVMLETGEDIDFISRRIIICASEDVGNADPKALEVAVSAAQAVKMIGMPEARIILAQAVTYIACAPKSNSSYLAINKTLEHIQKNGIYEIPAHLRDGGYGYKYAHNGVNHYLEQQYLPDKIKNLRFFEISEQGYEQKLKNYHRNIGNKQI